MTCRMIIDRGALGWLNFNLVLVFSNPIFVQLSH